MGVQAQETLEDLLRQVEQAASEEARVDQERLQRFIRERANHAPVLEEARAETSPGKKPAPSACVMPSTPTNCSWSNWKTILDERMGNLGELFGVVRQVAGDLSSTIEESMVSAQLPGRSEFLAELGQRRELPTVDELSQMWLEMVREIYQSGRVVTFTAPVVNSDWSA